jgi:hypothetical protein
MGRFDVRWQIVPEDDGAWEIGLSELLLIIDYCTGEHAQIEKRVINPRISGVFAHQNNKFVASDGQSAFWRTITIRTYEPIDINSLNFEI